MDPGGGSTARTPPWSQVASLATHIRMSLTILESPCANMFLLLFLFHFFITYLILLMVPGVSECPGHLRRGLRSAVPHLHIMALGMDHIQHGLSPPQDWVVPDWCSFQDIFLFDAVWWSAQAHYLPSPPKWALALTPTHGPQCQTEFF